MIVQTKYLGPLDEAIEQRKRGNLAGAWLFINLHNQRGGTCESLNLAEEIRLELLDAPRSELTRL